MARGRPAARCGRPRRQELADLNAALGEDLALVRRMQTVNSRPLAPDIQFGRNEAVNQDFHRKLADLAGDDPASRPV